MIHLLLALIVSAVPLLSAASGDASTPGACFKCHENVYQKAQTYRYQHSVVWKQCPLCHIQSSGTLGTAKTVRSLSHHQEQILYLPRLKPDKGYAVTVTATDREGRESASVAVSKGADQAADTWTPGSSSGLSSLSGVRVDSIEKRAFARAVLSWNTDAFATSEAEYWLAGGTARQVRIKDVYAKNHVIDLDGLRHNAAYTVRAVSKDIAGNKAVSEEYTFNTSSELMPESLPDSSGTAPPVIDQAELFSHEGSSGFYLSVTTTAPARIQAVVSEVVRVDEKHGLGLLPPRTSQIEICYTCHPHDSSHPVGVKAEGPKVRTPEGLPTIEDGIITCVTCHEPHGGERIHYNRFDFRKDLCMRCHTDKYRK